MIFTAYTVGLCCASVCTSLSVEDATVELNKQHPTGIESQWKPSEDTHFRGGVPNGCDCLDYPGNKHFLMEC